jgi:hypothetical protein
MSSERAMDRATAKIMIAICVVASILLSYYYFGL